MKAQVTFRAIVFALATALLGAGFGGTPAALADEDFPRYLRLAAGENMENRPIRLGINKSLVIELPRPAGDVLVSNPDIADAVLRTSQRLYLIGVKLGQANIFLFDAAGAQIASFDVYVDIDLTALNRLLAEAIPSGIVRAEAMNGNIVLRGQVASSADSSRAQEITVGMLQGTPLGTEEGGGGGTLEKQVVNLLTIMGVEQVTLKVTIAEVQRQVVKQLGINLQAVIEKGNTILGATLDPPFGATFDPLNFSPLNFPFNSDSAQSSFSALWRNDGDAISGTLKALEETQMMRTLAEPTLTAVSGETANFLAGGEFPIPVSSTDGVITVTYKPFGVGLSFTPVVLSAGRISLKVRTEVSDVSGQDAFALQSSNDQTLVLPAFTTRRAETTIELPSGGAFVIAGLVKEEARRALSGLPGLHKLPILGALFSSKDFEQSETELVIIVTPYIVKPVSPRQLARPDDNMVLADDAEAYFLGRLTKTYGSAEGRPGGSYAGNVGFAFD